MKTSSREKSIGSYLRVRDEKWSRKKDALLERLSKDTRTVKLDKENLVADTNRRSKEVERLEEENNAIAKQVKNLQNELLKKRTAAKEVFKRSDALKRKLVELLARKR